MHDKQEPGEWSVYDTAARQEDPAKPGEIVPRLHESRAGRPWPLRYNKPCYMPESDARVFLKDASFIVHDEDGTLVPGLAKEALLRAVPTTLAANLVIADLNELTTDSLLTRAMQRTGGQKLSKATPRTALIQFLMDGLDGDGKDPGGAAAPMRRIRERDPDEIDDGATARMLEGV